MSENAALTGLTIVLLMVVGIFLFGISKIGCGIFGHYLRKRKSVRKVNHPKYGLLTGEGNLWNGLLQIGGKSIPFALEGSESEPDASSLNELGKIIEMFGELSAEAEVFLRTQEPEIRQARFEIYGVEVAANPGCFTLEFIVEQDDSVVWRVEFVAGKPMQIGYDD